ncbi:MAG: GIY-YIG nuclease family protein [Candidatus Odinarchaeota archaeon]
MNCFKCGYKWLYRAKAQKVHRCYNCGNIFITKSSRGLIYSKKNSHAEFNRVRPSFNYRKSDYCVYMLLTESGSIYTGMTNNIMSRLNQHVHGSGANHTKNFGVKTFLAHRYCKDKKEALWIEKLIQNNLFHDEKLELVTYWKNRKSGKPFPFTIWKAIQEGEEIQKRTGRKRNSFKQGLRR